MRMRISPKLLLFGGVGILLAPCKAPECAGESLPTFPSARRQNRCSQGTCRSSGTLLSDLLSEHWQSWGNGPPCPLVDTASEQHGAHTPPAHGLRNEMKESRQMRNIFQSRRGPQASLNRSERFLRLSGDDVAITMCPIAHTIVIIHRSLVFHATFLHHTSGSGILSFTFRVDQPG